jgi:hypothetical protein
MQPCKIKNLFRTSSFDDELRSIVHEKYFVLPAKGKSFKYKKSCVIYLSESKFYIKMVPKNQLYNTPKFADIDCEQLLNNFYKSNRYDFLPEYLFETPNFLCFKYYIDYTPLFLDDVIDTKFLKLSHLLNISLTPKQLYLTPFFKTVIRNFHILYKNEIVTNNVPLEICELLNFKTSSNLLNYLCCTPSNITLQDFFVKRDDIGKIVDWKYTNIDNWDILFPNYIFDIKDSGDDIIQHLQKINELYDKPTVVLTYESKYYDAGLISNIEN